MIGISVQGGTNAGIRRVKTLPSWFCGCQSPTYPRAGRKQPGTAYSCPDCGSRRPISAGA